MSPHTRHRIRCLLTSVGAVAGLVVLARSSPSGAGAPTGLDPLVPTGDAVGLLTTGMRAAALALLGYLTIVALLNLLLSTGSRRTGDRSRWLRRCSPRWLAAASVGVVVGSTVVSPAAGADPVTARRGPDPAQVTSDEPLPSVPRPTTMLPWSDDAPPLDPPRLEPIPADPTPTDAGRTPPPPTPLRHTVVPGEHFWSIAEAVVAERELAVPVVDYWRLLVEANRDRLVVPGDPDLIYPGQELVLP